MLSPNAQMHDIMKDALNLSSDFTKLDYILILAGSNDAHIRGCIYSESLGRIIRNMGHTNTIVATVLEWKCRRPVLNSIIQGINDQIRYTARENTANLLDIDSGLQHYHFKKNSNMFNNAGKHMICNIIKDIINSKKVNADKISKNPAVVNAILPLKKKSADECGQANQVIQEFPMLQRTSLTSSIHPGNKEQHLLPPLKQPSTSSKAKGTKAVQKSFFHRTASQKLTHSN
ncbi:unnamed protein product [Acanthoscelides obtectus]|uniref:Uncharacterized protein n=1 Tax=Acanthoscelides obtectus TaxID=200917 RepID=A0A9P0LM98_ACAOB|nr:unnamed protein product [Acanthoscelides obtectus]CAK1650174.1 hypothetical protein AOBTE_LOCUS16659 [Acanthoscelides obtectus]